MSKSLRLLVLGSLKNEGQEPQITPITLIEEKLVFPEGALLVVYAERSECVQHKLHLNIEIPNH